MIGGPNGGGLPVPPLGVTITPPDGVAQPVVTENIGSTTTVNNDAHVRVWVAQIPADGTYNITTDGQVNGFINPRLAFGTRVRTAFWSGSSWAMFVAGLLFRSCRGCGWRRTRRRAAASAVPGVSPPASLSAPATRRPARRRADTARRGRPAGAAQNPGGAAGFRCADRGGVRDREAPDPRRG